MYLRNADMTNKIQTIRVDLAEKLAPCISTRVAIQVLRNELVASSAKNIVLDFQHVESVSRSAAHELILTLFDLTNLFHKKVAIENPNDGVQAVLSAVTDRSIKSKPEERYVSQKTIDFEELCQLA